MGPSRSFSLAEIRFLLSRAGVEEYPRWLAWLETDGRRGAAELARVITRRWRSWISLMVEDRPRWEREASLRRTGKWLLAGVDEAGRGPLAGPVVAAAVILPPGFVLPGLDDSKRTLPARRRIMHREIRKRALAMSLGVVGARAIDRLNIRRASLLAMRRAVSRLVIRPDFVLVDGDERIPGLCMGQAARPGADGFLASVSAASVVAKVYRDSLMARYAQLWPAYGFDRHRGYGTAGHLEELARSGPCPIHRRSFMGDGAPPLAEKTPRSLEDGVVSELARGGARILCRDYVCRWGRAAAVAVDEDGPFVVVVGTTGTLSPLRRKRLGRVAASWALENGFDSKSVRCDLVMPAPAAGPVSAVRRVRGVSDCS